MLSWMGTPGSSRIVTKPARRDIQLSGSARGEAIIGKVKEERKAKSECRYGRKVVKVERKVRSKDGKECWDEKVGRDGRK